jgi:2-aminoethylphosphonate-pyruvate transaminase
VNATADNPYLLLTPGPLTTSSAVKESMLRDWCTWDDEYKELVQDIRRRLVLLTGDLDTFTSVLMQGSGTFSVESVLTSAIPRNGKLLVLVNGAYGKRMVEIARVAGMKTLILDSGELGHPDLDDLDLMLHEDQGITHVAVVHCETTTGMLNPVDEIGSIVKRYGKIYIVDAMSSFGGIPIDILKLQADFLVSSANKCIQGVPGFGFVIARRKQIEKLDGYARSHSLDLYDQWRVMEQARGKWRFTSPTHVVRAFLTALHELDKEGGVAQRFRRYRQNHSTLVAGMEKLGFTCLLEEHLRSPIITAFYNPTHEGYRFDTFYQALKSRGFVIYPGKVTDRDTFRIGTIGNVDRQDINRLLEAVEQSIYWETSQQL